MIENIVVLMLENRSFDQTIGFMRSDAFTIDGLTGGEFNYVQPHAPTPAGKIFATPDAPYVPDCDPSPGHEFGDVQMQLFGGYPRPQPSIGNNNGFAYNYVGVCKDESHAGRVMRCFAAGKLPVLGTLAKEYAVCDRWFSSLPGPTWPNRFFAHCATSGGFVDNAVRDYGMSTIYQSLSKEQINWRIYYHDFPQSLALRHQRQYFAKMYELYDQSFARDCANRLLPRYSFIEPRYFNEGASRANDQHPIHGAIGGELLIADVYENLRKSPQWENTLLIITWDEHGGFFDHVLPPATVSPDGLKSPEFDFTMLGLRVPAVLVSPLIPKGTIDHTIYDHSSILATARDVFHLPASLTHRDEKANTFLARTWLGAPRTDCIQTLPRPSQADVTASANAQSDTQPMNELQKSLVALGASLVPGHRLLALAVPSAEGAAARHLGALLEAAQL